VRWAVETLAVEPGDNVLEIGCGSGLAAALVCQRLVAGRMLAIDRSAVQIERARRRNETHLASGKLSLETVELADLDVDDDARFDKVFALNVNLFWVGPATEELTRVRRALAPEGELLLFYEAPGPSRTRHLVAEVAAVLEANGFEPAQPVFGTASRALVYSRAR
jgi:cyclopropane fatty-acyl-phospholipid synthase-like methyltransferase